MKKEFGFSLIELIVVVLILGIIAIFAIPRFVDFRGRADQAAVDGVAGSLAAASATNYAIRRANSSAGQAVDNCTDIGDILQGGLPSDYEIVSTSLSNNVTQQCTVRLISDNTVTAQFTGTGIS